MAKSRQSKNQIYYLESDQGDRIDSQHGIMKHCVDYFSSLMGRPQSAPLFDPEVIGNLLHYQCSDADKVWLAKHPTIEDVKHVFMSLPRNKAAGPDGYSAEFFKHCWSIVGADSTKAVVEFFRTGHLLKQWNSTSLALIPKIPNASKISDFRPISCCNSVYKAVSKLLAGRLQKILPSFISNAQSAFIPGRLLVENVLLATEIVHGYNRKGIGSRAMLKVDLRKAFDSVRWDFIKTTLQAINMPDCFVSWVDACVTTPSFSVVVNGEQGGFFRSTRGLRQGDSLSPYLFVIVMEVFSRLLNSKFASGQIGHHPNTANLNITHLMFADDVMIFFDGKASSLEAISGVLDEFAAWSGLVVNKDKTELFIAGQNHQETTHLSRFGFPIGSLPIRYLGLPLTHRKLKLSEYSPLLVKLNRIFKMWAVKSLSFAGRVQLLRSVIYGTINFWLSAFMLPKGCIKKIESMCSRFLWSGDVESSRGTKVSWEACCLPKKEGGLGLRRVASWNSTLLLRLIWLIFSQSGSLWVAWHRHHHIGHSSFWSLRVRTVDSWNWKTILKLRPIAELFVRCTLGNGQNASFWFDSWTPFGPLFSWLGHEGPRLLAIPLQAKVVDSCGESGWALPEAKSEEQLQLQILLTTLPLPTASSAVDCYTWNIKGKAYHHFSARETWEVLRPAAAPKPWSQSIWFKGATPSHAFIMWTAQLNRLPVRTRLASWGMQVPTFCCLCSDLDETRDHLLLHCDYNASVWNMIHVRLGLSYTFFTAWADLTDWTNCSSSDAPTILRRLLAQAAVYYLWKERNSRLHSGVSNPTVTIFRVIDKLIRNTINARRSRKQFRNLMTLWLQRE